MWYLVNGKVWNNQLKDLMIIIKLTDNGQYSLIKITDLILLTSHKLMTFPY